jgi:hypothetical protein
MRDQTKLEEYWREAKAFVKTRTKDPKDPPWFAFDHESNARWQWEQYFAWRGVMPIGLDYQRTGKIDEFLVPCESPEEFDPNYRPKVDWIEKPESRDGA